jgi:protein arginine N-methyltransferase 5
MVEEGMVVHGLAGYFESVLYSDVRIYQPVLTHAGNVQLVPNLLPISDPVIVHAATNVQVDF